MIAIGCMRLSTERDRDESRAIAVLHAALDGGVTFLDTADAYCWDATDACHNEWWIARAPATWNGDRSSIRVATKGGLTRPDGHWAPDGRARHLRAACEASRIALGVDRIHLYQLHALDPRTPLSTSVRALASLKRDGLIEHIGLCNVNVGQIEEARRITDIAAVQVELSVWHDDSFLNGVAEYCVANGLQLIAYKPLGGPQRVRRTPADPLLVNLAERHGATTFEIALAWLTDLSSVIVPIPGPTRVETARSVARANDIHLTDDDRARLDERFPSGQLRRRSSDFRFQISDFRFQSSDFERRTSDFAQPRMNGEIVLIMGLPGAGKTTLARTFVEQGYARLNRDEDGGSLRRLLPALDRLIESGGSRIVLDNTYVSRKSRASLLQSARKHGFPVRCVWLSTTIEDAQVNAATRMVGTYGRLLAPEEIRGGSGTGADRLGADAARSETDAARSGADAARSGTDEPRSGATRDVSAFGPAVQFRYQRELEPPHPSEGFSRIDTVQFERAREASFTNRAVIVWCDGVLSRSRSGRRVPSSADDVEVFEERGAVLRRYQQDGWGVLGLSWQPEIAEEVLTAEQVEGIFARIQERLGVAIDVLFCPHGGGPPVCWCRKPLPGLGVVLIQRYRLDPASCLYVGAGPQDPGFARRLGFQYRGPAEFFGPA
jgi:aryl-alcohol dehydrogenase-like predicted oxidoreductase/histidinol phosphatase-like enzyme/predicted kinase